MYSNVIGRLLINRPQLTFIDYDTDYLGAFVAFRIFPLLLTNSIDAEKANVAHAYVVCNVIYFRHLHKVGPNICLGNAMRYIQEAICHRHQMLR